MTDFVMDAYRAKWLVPPELAVFSDKRISSGLLTGADLVEAFDKYQPQEILFRRFRPGGGLVRTLQEDYRPARKTGGFIHAIRKTESAPRIEIKREEVIAALTIATADLASLSVGGGYPAHVDLKTGQHFGRSLKNEPLAPNEITTRPLGSTQEVGQCLRRVGLAADDELFQMLALSAGKALACSQRYGGGWGNSSIITASCSKTAADDEDHPMTIDDRATPSALDFLLDLRNDVSSAGGTLPGWLEPAITAGLKSLLEAQSEKGGWRQTYPPRDDPYAKDFTFNDGAISSVISTLVKAYHSTNDGQYRDAALRGGEFILATQGPEGQDGWAQQYGADLKPAAARTFEPVGYSSRETGDVMNTLLDLFAETGDERFAAAVAKARRWLDASEIRPETWARLYEPGTNRPIYGDRDGSVHYSLSELSEERQRGYEWQGSFDSVLRARARDDARIEGGVEGLKAFDEQAREPLPLSGDDLDRLSKLAQEVSRSGRWADGDIVSTAVFVQNCALLTRSLAELE